MEVEFSRCPPQRLPTPHRRAAGFTLIEVIVVVILFGVIFSMAVISLPERKDEGVEEEAERLFRLIQIAEEEAVVRATSIGLGVHNDGYRFYFLDGPDWKSITDDDLLRERELPEGVRITLILEGVDIVLDVGDELERPQLFVLDSGEYLPPFQIHINEDSSDALFTIRLNDHGLPEFEAKRN